MARHSSSVWAERGQHVSNAFIHVGFSEALSSLNCLRASARFQEERVGSVQQARGRERLSRVPVS
jgi:hypothetical protein